MKECESEKDRDSRLLSLHILLVVRVGDQKMERELHRMFAEWRLHGEWFEVTLELLMLIEAFSEREECYIPI